MNTKEGMKEYNYYIWFGIRNKNFVFEAHETWLTIHDLNGNKIGGDIIKEIYDRLSEIYKCSKKEIKVSNISLLCQHNQSPTLKHKP